MKVTLTVVAGPQTGATFAFERHDTFIVGRGKHAQFKLAPEDKFFSRHHFMVEVNPPLCKLIDLSSSNGTFVNGKRVASTDLKNDDVICGGDTIIRVVIDRTADEASASNGLTSSQKRIATEQLALTLQRVPLPDTSGAPSQRQGASAIHSLPQFAGYRTTRLLGRGGMGVVYEAESHRDSERVAIKMIAPKVAASYEDLSRFIREATILRNLVHPNIVRYRDMQHHEGNVFIVMDYIEGCTAKSVVASSEAGLSAEQVVQYGVQLLDGLHFAHQRGYVHRDVKPANLLIANTDRGDRLWLADFGLARTYQSSTISGLTMTGEMGGTTPFMPPEQITKYRNVEPAADQYSAAATLYYLLAKRHIYDFPREVPNQLLMILQDDPIPLDRRRTDIRPQLVHVIHKGLSRNPSDRFTSALEFRHALQRSLI